MRIVSRPGKGNARARISRRKVLKGGTALGLAGVGLNTGFAIGRARATNSQINIINVAGSRSLLQNRIFEDLRIFEKYGVDANLINVSDGSKIIASVISGDGDICCGAGFSGLFPAIEKGAKIKIVAGSGISPVSILYTNRSDITSVKDLVGRTVGTGAPGTALHQLVVADLQKHGVNYKSVTFANVGATIDVFRALVAGAIDAGPGPIEYKETAGKYKLSVVPDGLFYQELPLYNNQAMFSSEKAMAEKRPGLVGVMAAHADLFRWIGRPENKDAFIKYYLDANGPNVAAEAAFFQDFLSKPGRLSTGLIIKEDAVNYMQDLNMELGIQKAMLSYRQVADMSLAEEALKLVK